MGIGQAAVADASLAADPGEYERQAGRILEAIAALPDAIGQAVAERLPAVRAVERVIERTIEVGNEPTMKALEPVKSVNLQDLPVKRPSPKLQKALDWLTEHPEHIDTPSREIDALVGVSHMTVNKAQRIMRGEEVD